MTFSFLLGPNKLHQNRGEQMNCFVYSTGDL